MAHTLYRAWKNNTQAKNYRSALFFIAFYYYIYIEYTRGEGINTTLRINRLQSIEHDFDRKKRQKFIQENDTDTRDVVCCWLCHSHSTSNKYVEEKGERCMCVSVWGALIIHKKQETQPRRM